MRWRMVVGAGAATLMLLLVGCGPQEDRPAPATPAAVAGPTEWVAAFGTAVEPDELEADTAELQERVGPALIVGPVGCHDGLDEALGVPGGRYFVGVVAESEAELQTAIEASGRTPIFTGELTVLCD